ncbi:MAG: FAD/NAD(P)-binding oxidoreductase [Pseudomonadales bacterium]
MNNKPQSTTEAGKESTHAQHGAALPLFDVVIIGAGSAGIATAASLKKRRPETRVALIDPADRHYYQPGWTMVGGGVFDASSTEQKMQDLIPSGVEWIRASVGAFNTTDNAVVLSNGRSVAYRQLIVAAGLSLNWSAVEGLSETLGRNGVTSNYRYDLAPYTWQLVQGLQGGNALFTQPAMPIKCAGAPQKALYLSADHWLKQGTLKDINIHFFNAGAALFGVADYVPALQSYIDKYKTSLHYTHTLVRVDGSRKKAWFASKDDEGFDVETIVDFDMIHVCPPQCAPAFISDSVLADPAGWCDVDPNTLRHTRIDNVWGLGDVTNTPNAKTMAAARKQAPVVAQNLVDVLNGGAPSAAYDGYGSCPLTVERGKSVLAEFSYGGVVTPTFPRWINDGTQPTRLAWFLKAQILPSLYWHGMLKGREWLAASSA